MGDSRQMLKIKAWASEVRARQQQQQTSSAYMVTTMDVVKEPLLEVEVEAIENGRTRLQLAHYSLPTYVLAASHFRASRSPSATYRAITFDDLGMLTSHALTRLAIDKSP